MKSVKPLVDIPTLRKLVADLDLGDPKCNEYIEARWLKYVEWWDLRARQAKSKYQALRGAVVIGGALIPALVGLRELDIWAGYGWLFAVGSIAASLVVAICAGLDGLFGFGDIWREKRVAAELIKCEGFSFLQLTGEYQAFDSHRDALKRFTANVERLIRSEIEDYIVAVTPDAGNRPPAGAGGSLASAPGSAE